jgi:hypothetical protein
MSVIISRPGEPARKLGRTVIEREEYLQGYIHANPQALPFEELREDVQLSVLAREFPTVSGPIDAIAVDDHGEIYLIETKLYRNQDKRYVVAQILDYGAALWNSAGDPAALLDMLEQLCETQLKVSLRDRLATDLGLELEDVENLLHTVRSHFEEGIYRFVVLMDRIDDRLKTLLRFINENSRFDILGVELDYYRDDELEIMIPRLYGAEVRKPTGGRAGARGKWDEARFFDDVGRRVAPGYLPAIRSVYEWAQRVADRIVWGTGVERGSFNPRFHVASTRSIFTVWSDGKLSLNYGWFRRDDPGRHYADSLSREFAQVQALLPMVDTSQDYPAMEIERWAPSAADFCAAVERALTTPPVMEPPGGNS